MERDPRRYPFELGKYWLGPMDPSKPFDPHPLFASFIEAAVKQSRLV